MGSLPVVTRKISETGEGVRPLRNWLSSSQYAAFEAAGTNAHRIFSSPGGWMERFGDDLLLSYKDESVRDTILETLPTWCETTGFQPVRIFGKFLPKHNDERTAPVLLSGDENLPVETVVSENGMRFGLDFAAGELPLQAHGGPGFPLTNKNFFSAQNQRGYHGAGTRLFRFGWCCGGDL